MTDSNHRFAGDGDRVGPGSACPQCGENRIDELVWIEDDRVRSACCGTSYHPNQPDAGG